MTIGVPGDTVGAVIRRLQPRRQFRKVPQNPADVFAATAFLLEVSGAYHHIKPCVVPGAAPRTLWVTDAMRHSVQRAAQKWRPPSCAVPLRAVSLWRKLTAAPHVNSPVFAPLKPTDPHPEWWSVALELMMIADESAAFEAGWLQPEEVKTPWGQLLSQVWLEEALNAETPGHEPELVTLALETSRDMVCVLPKCRTATVGCTLRSMSHHLALLPPRGITRVYWSPPLFGQKEDAKALNLLLVPFPYRLSASAFCERPSELESKSWRWFGIDQEWLKGADAKENLVRFVKDLIKEAEQLSGPVNGVVFPELALNYDIYLRLRDELQLHHLGVELLVAGVSTDQNGFDGNFVALTVFNRDPVTQAPDRAVKMVTRVRQKHHRWKLDSSQIEAYALSPSLSPSLHWWEDMNILSRSVDVVVFRKFSAVTTLICEDLARVDPCQEALRAIGPNLVVALLMDGAQIDSRWPHRYATVLAEDPGSSVLTLTSLALITRANDEGAYAPSRAIAAWKDTAGGRRSIQLPDGAEAVLLTLSSREVNEHTLDGRNDTGLAIRWEYAGQQPVRLPRDVRGPYRQWLPFRGDS